MKAIPGLPLVSAGIKTLRIFQGFPDPGRQQGKSRYKPMKTISWIFAGLLAGSAMAKGADYAGAKAALEEAAAAAARDKEGGEEDSPLKLDKELQAFQAEAAGLPPKDAAARWLALVERGLNAPRDEMRYSRGFEFGKYVKALPPPAAWPELRAALAARKPTPGDVMAQTLGLRWFVNRLLNDTKAMQADYDAITKLLGDSEGDYAARQARETLEAELFSLSDDGEALLKRLNERLEAAVKGADGPRERYGRTRIFQVPDLATLAGREKASEFLTRALTTYDGTLDFQRGEETLRLARELALKNAARLKAAQWGLAAGFEESALYDALLKKFGPPGDDPRHFMQAQAYEFLRLLAAGKTEEAAALSKKMDPSVLSFVREIRQSDAVAAFFQRLLTENPALPYWNIYIESAARAGKSQEMLTLLRAALKGDKVQGETRRTVEEALVKGLLAAGEIDEAVPLLARDAEKEEDRRRYRNDENSLLIARIGMLMDRKEWVTQGLALAAKKWGKLQKAIPFEGESFASAYARLLMDLNRGPEAEAVLITALGFAEAKNRQADSFRSSPDSQDVLANLAGLYIWAKRYDDVVVLLDQAPGWGAADLRAVNQYGYIGNDRIIPIEAGAARALAATGKKDAARRMINALLDEGSQNDRVYELLIELDGQDAMATLDRVFARDPFEERPLIWKARLLLDAGKVDEAEKVARQAIKIDPSDGGQGSGDRMRVYDVLAQALAAKGDTGGAEFFQGVTKAIRLSEEADDFYAPGLYTQAIKRYE